MSSPTARSESSARMRRGPSGRSRCGRTAACPSRGRTSASRRRGSGDRAASATPAIGHRPIVRRQRCRSPASPPACRRSPARCPGNGSSPTPPGRPRCTGGFLRLLAEQPVEQLVPAVERFEIAGRRQGVDGQRRHPDRQVGVDRPAPVRAGGLDDEVDAAGDDAVGGRRQPLPPGPPLRSGEGGESRIGSPLPASGRGVRGERLSSHRPQTHHHETRQRRRLQVAAARRLDALQHLQAPALPDASARTA